MIERFVGICLFLCLFSLSSAQYHLGESGVLLGAGTTLPFQMQSAKPGLNIHGDVFYSHYVCGKRYGYHATLGYRMVDYTGLLTDFTPVTTSKGFLGRFQYIDAGFFLKIRKNEYHRPNEFALLVGPKFNLLLSSFARELEISTDKISLSSPDPSVFLPGLHLSIWMKRKLGSQSLFIQPGIEYYFVSNYEKFGTRYNGIHLFLNAGISIWNSKKKFKFKG